MYSENNMSAQENALDVYFNLMDSTGRSSDHRKSEHPIGCRLAVAIRDL